MPTVAPAGATAARVSATRKARRIALTVGLFLVGSGALDSQYTTGRARFWAGGDAAHSRKEVPVTTSIVSIGHTRIYRTTGSLPNVRLVTSTAAMVPLLPLERQAASIFGHGETSYLRPG